jgi:hypothetical protein
VSVSVPPNFPRRIVKSRLRHRFNNPSVPFFFQIGVKSEELKIKLKVPSWQLEIKNLT